MKLVITGGSGQIGTLLARHFQGRQHTVRIIARSAPAVPWEQLPDEVNGADVVINLAGRSVNCRYTATNRRRIRESRLHTVALVGEAIARASHPPALWINASTATIYRHTLDRPMDEQTGEFGGNEPGAPATWRFSIDVATSWESVFAAAPAPRTRKIAMRSAMVMSPDHGGVFDTLLRLVRFGLGGAAGKGDQYVSWIHEHDFCRSLDFLIASAAVPFAVNLASPNPLPNRDFMRALRQAWGIEVGLPAPAWLLEIGAFLLRTETELILKSRRVVPGYLQSQGFTFQFPAWPMAAQDLVARSRFGLAQD